LAGLGALRRGLQFLKLLPERGVVRNISRPLGVAVCVLALYGVMPLLYVTFSFLVNSSVGLVAMGVYLMYCFIPSCEVFSDGGYEVKEALKLMYLWPWSLGVWLFRSYRPKKDEKIVDLGEYRRQRKAS